MRIMLLLLLIFMMGCQKKDNFIIKGYIEGLPENTMLYLDEVKEFADLRIDSTFVSQGKFIFKGIVETPAKYTLKDDASYYLFLWLDGGEINIQGKASNFYNAEILGGEFHKTSKLYSDSLNHQRYLAAEIQDTLHQYDKHLDTLRWTKLLAALKEIDSIKIRSVKRLPQSKESLERLYYGKWHWPRYMEGELIEKLRPFHDSTEMFKLIEKHYKSRKDSYINERAPSFNQVLISGDNASFPEDYKGHWVLLNFTATFCLACHENRPFLQSLNKEGLEIISVYIDKSEAPVLKEANSFNISWPIIADTLSTSSASAMAYNVGGVPEYFLVDPDGIIRGTNTELRDGRLDKNILAIINTKIISK